MDPLQTEQGTGWAQVAPLILARQREIADRVAADAAQAPTGAAVSERSDRVQPAVRAVASAQATSGEAGRGQGGQTQPDKTDASGLSEAEQKMVADLRARDAEVRRHEQAHAAVGGQYAGMPTYTYQTGPDGRQYAIGGAVAIDVSPVDGDPDATIDKMEVVKAAALAPAAPSSADRQVAALADAQRAQAVADLAVLRAAERDGTLEQRV